MLPKFSKRTQWDLQESAYSAALQLAKLRGALLDLTASNPTTCGLIADAQHWRETLLAADSSIYDPNPRGMCSARVSVAKYYWEQTKTTLDPDNIFLTTSTSEAYSFLFRLLCDAGDEILIAQPSYPLFEFLADLDDVQLIPYPLFYDHGWHLDLAAMEARITPRTRAIILVHPNNPTGHFTSVQQRSQIEGLAKCHGLALIVDEVFLDYAVDASREIANSASFVSGEHPVLTFVLSGISKICALPQMKVAWISVRGTQEIVTAATERLEVIADTFLSMNTPIQHALPAMLEARHEIQKQITGRVRTNLAELDRQLHQQGLLSRLLVEAGWYVVVRIPALGCTNAAAIRLLEAENVLVHPGDFYGFAGEGWLIVSLLTPTDEFDDGIMRLIRFFHSEIESQRTQPVR